MKLTLSVILLGLLNTSFGLNSADTCGKLDWSEEKKCCLEPLRGSRLGDIQASILDPRKFELVNGSEWKLMNGKKMHKDLHDFIRNSDIKRYMPNGSGFKLVESSSNWISSYYTNLLNFNGILPDARGRFLRMHNNSATCKGSRKGENCPHIPDDHRMGDSFGDLFRKHSHQLFVTIDKVGGGHPWGNVKQVGGVEVTDRGLPSEGSSARYLSKTGANSKHGRVTELIHYNGSTETRPKNVIVNYYIKDSRSCFEDANISGKKALELMSSEWE